MGDVDHLQSHLLITPGFTVLPGPLGSLPASLPLCFPRWNDIARFSLFMIYPCFTHDFSFQIDPPSLVQFSLGSSSSSKPVLPAIQFDTLGSYSWWLGMVLNSTFVADFSKGPTLKMFMSLKRSQVPFLNLKRLRDWLTFHILYMYWTFSPSLSTVSRRFLLFSLNLSRSPPGFTSWP